MNVATLKQMQQDPAMIAAAAAVFTFMAREQVIREMVEPVQDEVLKFFKFQLCPDWVERYQRNAIPIPEYLDRKNAYLMTDEDMQIYCKELHTRHVAAGLKKDSEEVGRCPLLCAESDTREAKRLMVDLTEEYTDVVKIGIELIQVFTEEEQRQVVDKIRALKLPENTILDILTELAQQPDINLDMLSELWGKIKYGFYADKFDDDFWDKFENHEPGLIKNLQGGDLTAKEIEQGINRPPDMQKPKKLQRIH